jgi:hypothetical protein
VEQFPSRYARTAMGKWHGATTGADTHVTTHSDAVTEQHLVSRYSTCTYVAVLHSDTCGAAEEQIRTLVQGVS